MIRLWELMPLGQVNQKINIVVNIDKTKQVSQKSHDGKDSIIPDEDIINLVDMAAVKIGKLLMFNHVNIGDTLHIKHKDLNIIGQLQEKKGQLEYTVISVIKKQTFYPKPNIKTVEI